MALTQKQVEQWKPLLEDKGFAKIKSRTAKRNFVQLMENSVKEGVFTKPELIKKALNEQAEKAKKMLTEAPVVSTGNGIAPNMQPDNSTTGNVADGTALAGYDPILISVLRRTAPLSIAEHVAGTQALAGPTGLIFALHARVLGQDGKVGPELWGGSSAQYLNKGIQLASGTLLAGTELTAAQAAANTVAVTQITAQYGHTYADRAAVVTAGIAEELVTYDQFYDFAMRTKGLILTAGGYAKVSTAVGEQLGLAGASQWARASMTFSRISVTAETKGMMA